jgi:hypothetical protein
MPLVMHASAIGAAPDHHRRNGDEEESAAGAGWFGRSGQPFIEAMRSLVPDTLVRKTMSQNSVVTP